MTLQEKILYCRKKQGLSQEALAEKIGVSRQAISKWETGEATPEVGKLSLLAKTFHVTVDWLLSEEAPEETTTTANNNYSSDGDSDFLFGKRDYQNRRGLFARIHRMIVKYSWIAGVYIALAGLLFAGLGFGSRVMFNSMFNIASDQMNSMNERMTMYTEDSGLDYDEADKQDLEEFQKDVGEFFPEAVEDVNTEDSNSTKDVKSIGSSVNNTMSGMNLITNGFTLVIIIFGLVTMIVGIVLVVYLKVKANKKKE